MDTLLHWGHDKLNILIVPSLPPPQTKNKKLKFPNHNWPLTFLVMALCRRGISMLRVVILMPRQMNSSTTGGESKVTSLISCTQPKCWLTLEWRVWWWSGRWVLLIGGTLKIGWWTIDFFFNVYPCIIFFSKQTNSNPSPQYIEAGFIVFHSEIIFRRMETIILASLPFKM